MRKLILLGLEPVNHCRLGFDGVQEKLDPAVLRKLPDELPLNKPVPRDLDSMSCHTGTSPGPKPARIRLR